MNVIRAWWTARELAEHYSMSVRTIYAEIETGRLPSHRFGGARGALRVADADRLEWEASSRRGLGPRPMQNFRPRISDSAGLVEKHLR